jgi:hypothetical protein
MVVEDDSSRESSPGLIWIPTYCQEVSLCHTFCLQEYGNAGRHPVACLQPGKLELHKNSASFR